MRGAGQEVDAADEDQVGQRRFVEDRRPGVDAAAEEGGDAAGRRPAARPRGPGRSTSTSRSGWLAEAPAPRPGRLDGPELALRCAAAAGSARRRAAVVPPRRIAGIRTGGRAASACGVSAVSVRTQTRAARRRAGPRRRARRARREVGDDLLAADRIPSRAREPSRRSGSVRRQLREPRAAPARRRRLPRAPRPAAFPHPEGDFAALERWRQVRRQVLAAAFEQVRRGGQGPPGSPGSRCSRQGVEAELGGEGGEVLRTPSASSAKLVSMHLRQRPQL